MMVMIAWGLFDVVFTSVLIHLPEFFDIIAKLPYTSSLCALSGPMNLYLYTVCICRLIETDTFLRPEIKHLIQNGL